MKNTVRKKVAGLIVSFIIGAILSAILSYGLVCIFSRQPAEFFNISVGVLINNIINNTSGLQIFVVSLLAFMIFMLLSVFKVFNLNDYLSKYYAVTPDIKIPLPVGKNQTQQGSAWWLDKKDLYKKPFRSKSF